uniref:TM254 protein n=1 Tax=Mesocestoides corti TaxID=53468 RepID=A0A5K3FKF8_MESCO
RALAHRVLRARRANVYRSPLAACRAYVVFGLAAFPVRAVDVTIHYLDRHWKVFWFILSTTYCGGLSLKCIYFDGRNIFFLIK